jgi:aryl-alcohol dehydrogenase-like predicted oxidoreductase
MSIPGWATPAGTARYRERFQSTAAPHHFHDQQGLWLSSIGIGTYLGEPDAQTDARYADTVKRTVELGANVIDTAANYRFQRSERAIGKALEALSQEGFARDEIVLCTKGGYLPFDGAPPSDVRRYVEETFVRPGIATLEDIVGGSHCMTPAYLESQLDQSLRNMNVDCIDVYYIHNPESQLGAVSSEEFYERLRRAFAFLEQARVENKIRMYGVATWNGFRVAAESRQFHSLTRMVELAREAGGESHGFRFIQMPFSLAMLEALSVRNHNFSGKEFSIIEVAAALGVSVVASASISQGQVARGLPESIREPLGSLATDAQTAIQFVRSTPGITTALVGMSSRAHVEENLKLVNVEPVTPEDLAQLF